MASASRYNICMSSTSSTSANMRRLCQPARIRALCGAAAQSVAIEVVPQTGSTNADLLARAASLTGPLLLLAHDQTAGRGRAGRSWLSSPEGSLTFSLAWQFHCPLQELIGLPLTIGVALADAFAQLNVRVALKWPNDILQDGKKLAGILIETAAVKEPAATWAVIGIGINLQLPTELAQKIAQPAANLGSQTQDRETIMAVLLETLVMNLQQFEAQGFAAFHARWNALHAYAGQAVALIEQGRIVQEGLAAGVDTMGRMQLDTASAGRIHIMAGDVSLRSLVAA